VLLVAPAPIEEVGWLGEIFVGGRVKSHDLAPRFQKVAARHGCGFLDAGRVCEVDPEDGVHLTEEAHASLAEALLAYFRDAMS
jgi:lysophospholipase L1-like esterase